MGRYPYRAQVPIAVTLLLVWLGVSTLGISSLEAQAPGSAPGLPTWADSFAILAPGPQYAKGGLGATLAGRHYRDLWTTRIQVPVVDLHRFAGGLTPVEEHTGSQTKSLRLVGEDGREYQFRSNFTRGAVSGMMTITRRPNCWPANAIPEAKFP